MICSSTVPRVTGAIRYICDKPVAIPGCPPIGSAAFASTLAGYVATKLSKDVGKTRHALGWR